MVSQMVYAVSSLVLMKKKQIVWVQFPNDIGRITSVCGKRRFGGDGHSTPIEIQKSTFKIGAKNNQVNIQRTQFPLVLPYAISNYNSQGQTLNLLS